MDITHVTMIMKDDESWVILSWTLVLKLSLKCVFHQVLDSVLCCVHLIPNYTQNFYYVSDRVHIE
jgi:hypothetical protein